MHIKPLKIIKDTLIDKTIEVIQILMPIHFWMM